MFCRGNNLRSCYLPSFTHDLSFCKLEVKRGVGDGIPHSTMNFPGQRLFLPKQQEMQKCRSGPGLYQGMIYERNFSNILTRFLFNCQAIFDFLHHNCCNQSSDILQHSQNRPTGDRWLKF